MSLLAFFAETVNLEPMPQRFETHFARNLLDRFLYRCDRELLGLAAGCADQVAVLVLIERSFETGSAIAEIHLAGQAGLGQEPESAIDCREPNLGIAFPDDSVKLIGGDMFHVGEKDIEYLLALPGLFKTLLFQKTD